MTTDVRREARPLLARFPLAVMSIALFLVIFAVLMARVPRGTGQLASGGPLAALVRKAPRVAARTRASGGAGATAAPSVPLPAHAPAIVTHSSGGTAAGAETDD